MPEARGLVGGALRAALAAILPPRCVACATPLDDEQLADGDWCAPCHEQLTTAPPPGLLLYGGPLAGLIQRAKYSRDAGAAAALARLFAARLVGGLDDGGLGPVDAVTFVPAHPLRVVARGFDLPGLLADAAAARLGVPMWMALRAARRDPRLAQSTSVEERARLVAGRFRATRALAGQRLLLVDDVHTTGATVTEAAATLAAAGAAEVVVRTLALTPSDG